MWNYPGDPVADSPLAPHAASPSELRDRIEAERRGTPFLVVREDDGPQRIVELDGETGRMSIGRAPSNDVSLPGDTEVSRLHAELECMGGEWTVSDDGLSRNGTWVNGSRISGRHRLRDGDVVRVGRSLLAYRRPGAEEVAPTHIAGPTVTLDDLNPTQRAILAALARPYRTDGFAVPATNGEIAEEVHLSVDAVKGHLRVLFARFGIEALPQNQKRSRLAAEAMRAGLVPPRD